MADTPRDWIDGSAVRLDRQDPYLRLQSITIYVRNLDRSLDFYVNQLGFQLVFDARSQEFAGRRAVRRRTSHWSRRNEIPSNTNSSAGPRKLPLSLSMCLPSSANGAL